MFCVIASIIYCKFKYSRFSCYSHKMHDFITLGIYFWNTLNLDLFLLVFTKKLDEFLTDKLFLHDLNSNLEVKFEGEKSQSLLQGIRSQNFFVVVKRWTLAKTRVIPNLIWWNWLWQTSNFILDADSENIEIGQIHWLYIKNAK